MRDEIFDLAAFRGIGPGPKLQPVPIQTLPLGPGAGLAPGKTSFQQALEQAANARRALPYQSPMARSTTNVPQSTIRRVPLPHPRPQTSTITPRSSLDVPPTSITR